MTDLDPKLTFDSFIVGPSNRLASAAARRAAESPGTSYNPLFVYSASGLGKSHILTAIAHHASKAAGRKVEYLTLEGYLNELADALGAGSRDGLRARYETLDVLLLDDVQFLAGQPEAQEMLLRTLDRLSSAGGQIVLASDRPPAEIDGLDSRLLSRFSGGLIVDIGSPEYETRVAIIRRKADERGQSLSAGVAEALARFPFRNVRELGGALNRILVVQDLEERDVTPEEVAGLMGVAGEQAARPAEFDGFLEDVASEVAASVEAREEPWRRAVREAADAAEREGFSAAPLRALEGGEEPEGWEEMIESFRSLLRRLREIDAELERLGNPWPDAARDLLRDPDRLAEAESLLTSVRERQRAFPALSDGPELRDLADLPQVAVRAADRLVSAERPDYNPLYLWSSEPGHARAVVAAAARTHHQIRPEARVAVTSVRDFAADFIRALGEGVAGAWRERWWTVDLLLVHGVEALSETERAQDEFFHLFEALKRRGARVMLAADRPPSRISSIDERLRSRFEGGLVLEVESGSASEDLVLVEVPSSAAAGQWGAAEDGSARATIPPLEEIEIGDRAGLLVEASEEVEGELEAPAGEPAADAVPPSPARGGPWFPSPERVVIQWPRLQQLLLEELD